MIIEFFFRVLGKPRKKQEFNEKTSKRTIYDCGHTFLCMPYSF